MCGIAGIIHTRYPEAGKEAITKMSEAIAHRGPDGKGTFEEGPVFLAHRRLSIIDLSEKGAQPMLDSESRYVIVFNGEIYNYQKLKSELSDYAFQSQSDCEVILAAYKKWGKDCLQKLEGMFAFAIWDKVEKELFIARDRFGVKPLYFALKDQVFLFSSEIRSIFASGLIPRRLNTEALSEYLSFQTIGAPFTLAKDISMLGPGMYLTWNNGALFTAQWWDTCRSTEGINSSNENVQKKTRQLLLNAVESRMVADVPVGAFLSGGIDSSAIVGLMSEVSTKPVETFSVIFEDENFNEGKWSDQIARKFRTNHHPILLKPQTLLENLPGIFSAMDHPSGDGPNSYIISKVVRERGLKVALSGVGSDEIFGGYPFFQQLDTIQNGSVFKWPLFLRSSMGKFFRIIPGGRKGKKMSEFLSLKNRSLEMTLPLMRTLFTKEQILNLVKNNPGELQVRMWMKENKIPFNRLSLYSKISAVELSHYLVNVLLRDTDQMSMAHGLEVREPFLDHKLVSYVLSLDDKFKKGRNPKTLLTDAVGDLLPSEIVQRKKMGFTFPWTKWLKNELKSFCEERMKRLDQRGIFKYGLVNETWNNFLKGSEGIIWNHVWILVVLEEWLEKNAISEI